MVLRASHTPLNFGDLEKILGFSVGFDSMFDRWESVFDFNTAQNNTKYPPYNIRREGDEKYFIELAIAGLNEDDLEVSLQSQVLNIRSKKENSGSEETTNYVHRGIAKRQFEREFTLSDDIIVKGCDLSNGMLTIELEKIIPEEKRARLIPIGNKKIKSIN